MNNTGIIILAAGNSSRLRSMKQLLYFNNKTLLKHVSDEAIESGAQLVTVVTGAHADEMSKEINHEKATIVFNEQWERGMASGIVAGLQEIIALHRNLEKVIIAVCDQPFISSALFRELYQKQHESAKDIIACSYAETVGTPVLFTKKYFGKLLNLQGDKGAKKILKAYQEDVATIDFSQGNIDIDTQKDYEQLMANDAALKTESTSE